MDDSIEVFLGKEFNYTEEQMLDFKKWIENNRVEIEKNMPYTKSYLYKVYVGYQLDRAKRRS